MMSMYYDEVKIRRRRCDSSESVGSNGRVRLSVYLRANRRAHGGRRQLKALAVTDHEALYTLCQVFLRSTINRSSSIPS